MAVTINASTTSGLVMTSDLSGSLVLQANGTTVLTASSTTVTAPSVTTNGVSFPATQVPSADANTLDDYEEGTWTPNQGSGLTVVGSFSSSGTYTKIGRQVTIIFQITGSTTIAAASGGATICTNIPFTVAGNSPVGSVSDNQTATVGGVFYINTGTTTCFTNTALTAKNQYIFTATYFV